MFALLLDGILLAIVLLVFSPRLTGLPLHEWLGIALCVPVLVHLLLSWEWIANAVRTFATSRRRTRINFVLNVAMFVLVVVEIVSGLVISRVALPFFGIATINDRSWRLLHNLSLNWTLLAVGLHVAMNWRLIVSMIRSRSRVAVAFPRAIRRSALTLLAAGVIACACFALLGRPSWQREYRQNEIARFAPAVGHGALQLGGHAALLTVIVYVARRWLRVRL